MILNMAKNLYNYIRNLGTGASIKATDFHVSFKHFRGHSWIDYTFKMCCY